MSSAAKRGIDVDAIGSDVQRLDALSEHDRFVVGAHRAEVLAARCAMSAPCVCSLASSRKLQTASIDRLASGFRLQAAGIVLQFINERREHSLLLLNQLEQFFHQSFWYPFPLLNDQGMRPQFKG